MAAASHDARRESLTAALSAPEMRLHTSGSASAVMMTTHSHTRSGPTQTRNADGTRKGSHGSRRSVDSASTATRGHRGDRHDDATTKVATDMASQPTDGRTPTRGARGRDDTTESAPPETQAASAAREMRLSRSGDSRLASIRRACYHTASPAYSPPGFRA